MGQDEPTAKAPPARMAPDLFADKATGSSAHDKPGDAAAKPSKDDDDSDEKATTKKGFFAKMFSWW